jgi:Lrp/AsnC family leucine-responsive transcriptional regulator
MVHILDEIDKQILVALARNCRITYQELARRHGISANAIRRRIMNLEESGEISKYVVTLSAGMIGSNQIFGYLTSDGSRDEVEMTDQIGSHPNIIAAAAYSTGTYAFVANYDTAQEMHEISSFLRNIKSVIDAEIHPTIIPPGQKMELTKLHLRILKFLVQDPRLSVVEIANKSGLTARRVRRLLGQLEESGAVQFKALVELGAASSIPFIARIRWNERGTTYEQIIEWLEQKYPLAVWEHFVSATEPTLFTLLSGENLTDVNEMTREIRRHPDIESVITSISSFHKFFASARHKKLDEMIEALEL